MPISHSRVSAIYSQVSLSCRALLLTQHLLFSATKIEGEKKEGERRIT